MSLLLLFAAAGGWPTGSIAVGRRAPKLKVLFGRVATTTGQVTPIGGLDFAPDVVSLQCTTALNVGYQQAQVVYDLQPYLPGPAELHHYARLEERDEIRGFIHVEITDGIEIIWEGRISSIYAPGGRFARFDAIGYGKFAAKDYPLQWTDATTQYTSGQVLVQALATAAPMLHPGAQNAANPQVWAPGIQFVDPGVLHTRADIANTKYLDEVLNQIVAEGNLQGQRVWYGVYEDRTFYLLPLVPPAQTDYRIDWDQAVDYKADVENMYGALVLAYSGGNQSPLTWPAGGLNPAWVNQWGLSINGFPRTAHLSGGTLSDVRALAVAQTQFGAISQPTITAKATIGGPVNEGELDGIGLSTGGTRGPHLIRAGETVQIGAADAGHTVAVPIARTTLVADGGKVENVLELGQPWPDIHQQVAVLRAAAQYQALGTSPVTGAPV